MATTVVNGVVVERSWYLSKKIWLCAIALGIALYQGITGKAQNLTADQIAAQVASTATWLAPVLTTILAIAHVDAKTRAAAILAGVEGTATSLDKPDA